MPATMCAIRTAPAIALPAMTTPQTTDAIRWRRIAAVAGKRFTSTRGDRPMDSGIRAAEIRCRKTQYVHAW